VSATHAVGTAGLRHARLGADRPAHRAGLTTGDIINAIESQNVQAAVGRIGARPISSDQRLQLNIRTKGRLTSPRNSRPSSSATNPDGSVLRLGDVARLELGAANMDRETRLNGGPASAIAIYQAPGANAIATLAAVRAKLTELQKRFPEDLEWKVTYDPTVFVTDTIHEVAEDADRSLHPGDAGGLSVPRQPARHPDPDVRCAGQPDRHFRGAGGDRYSANTVSLLAVVLAIGIVVDDAIVVVENVEHVMETHPELSPAEATSSPWARSPRRSSPSRSCCCRYSCRWRSCPASPASCPAVCRHRCRLDVPVGRSTR